MGNSIRGQSDVIGIVLLIGFTTIVISSAVVLGGSAISDLSSATESENALNSMSHVESEMSAVAIGESTTRQVALSQTSEGIYHFDPDSGRATVSYTVDGSEKWDVSRDLGAVVYNGSRRDVAYQGGGVWMKQDDFTDVVSSPEYYYQDNTLVFPIIQLLSPNSQSVGYGDVTTQTQLEGEKLKYPLTEGTVKITIQSPYYRGWYTFFEDRTEGDSKIYHSNNTVVSELVVPDKIRLDNAVSLESEYDPQNRGNNDKSVVQEDELEDNVPHASADPLIQSELSSASSSNDNGDHSCISEAGGVSGCTVSAGTYYIDSDVDLSDDFTLDVSDGDITIAVDGDFDFNSETVSVTGDSENVVKYYINGSLRGQGNGAVTHASGGDATQNQFYVGDGVLDDAKGGGTIDIEGVVYAPDATVTTGGAFEIRGVLIAHDLDVNGNAGKIRRGNVPEDYVLDITGSEDTIEYLHITTNRVEVDLENNNAYVSSYQASVDNQCSWVESQIDSNDDLYMSGQMAVCDVSQGVSGSVDDVGLSSESLLIGSVDVGGSVQLDRSHVTGSISTSADDITAISDSIVEGDIYSQQGGNIQVSSGSVVHGSVVAEGGSVDFDDAIISGDVYAEETAVECTNTEIGPNSKSCDEYDFRDPSQQ